MKFGSMDSICEEDIQCSSSRRSRTYSTPITYIRRDDSSADVHVVDNNQQLTDKQNGRSATKPKLVRTARLKQNLRFKAKLEDLTVDVEDDLDSQSKIRSGSLKEDLDSQRKSRTGSLKLDDLDSQRKSRTGSLKDDSDSQRKTRTVSIKHTITSQRKQKI